MRYVIVTQASLNAACASETDTALSDVDESLLEIASYEGQPLLFDNIHDAEDYMDLGDQDVETVVIEAPESISGIVIT